MKFPNKFIAFGIYNILYSLKPLLEKRLLHKLMGDEKQPVGPPCSQNNILSFVLCTRAQLFFGLLGACLYFYFHYTSVPSLPQNKFLQIKKAVSKIQPFTHKLINLQRTHFNLLLVIAHVGLEVTINVASCREAALLKSTQ